MISVLIPVYNYNIVALIKEIHSQVIDCKIPFEIIALEDGSTSENITINQEINTFSDTKLLISKKNIGRIAARQILSDNAKFDWLLFLDADTMPKSKTFIASYLTLFNSNFDAIYGGCAYEETKPKPEFMLRWVYGKVKEEVAANIRNDKPYKSIVSVNFMIKKAIFNLINSQINHRGYGLDNMFGALLKSNQIKVHHVNNEVYHLGLEASDLYLEKKEEAAQTLLRLYKEEKISNRDNELLTLFKKLKRFKLNNLASLFYKIFKNGLKKNLTSSKPSIKILQLYRITYMCYFDLNSEAKK